jgi:DNA-binding MarR family transcriptional regulator
VSAKLTGQVWELDLPNKLQSVLLALADNAHDDGTNCYPGVDYLAWKTGYDRRSVQRLLRQLEERGLIVPVINAEGGRGRELEYRIDISRGVKKRAWSEVREEIRRAKVQKRQEKKRATECLPLSDPKVDKMPLFEGEKGRQNEPLKGDKTDPKGRQNEHPPSITEPSTEPTTEHTHTVARATGKGCVCVCSTPHGSKLCDEERIRIAGNMVGIKFPERYAMTLEARRGTYDAAFLKRQRELKKPAAPGTPERDTSLCPDCRGQNFTYPFGDTPEGRARGVKKCEHPRLDQETERLQAEYEQNRLSLDAPRLSG